MTVFLQRVTTTPTHFSPGLIMDIQLPMNSYFYFQNQNSCHIFLPIRRTFKELCHTYNSPKNLCNEMNSKYNTVRL